MRKTECSPRPSRFRRAARALCAAALAFLASLFQTARADSPDPASSAFLTVTDTQSASNEAFNNAQRKTHAVEIVGMTVTIDPTTSLNAIHSTYNNRPDIKTFTVYADTVVLRGRLLLPQTAVRIVAKNIVFQTLGGNTNDTEIVATPQALTQRPAGTSGAAGANGLRGGDAYLYWHSISADPQILRGIVVDGGAGQPAGLGANGAKGASLATYNGGNGLPAGWPSGTVYLFYLSNGSPITVFGTNAYPANGKNAVAAGRPGEGGDSGNLFVTAGLPFFPSLSGGAAGLMGLTTTGGDPGDPVPARHVRYNPGSATAYTTVGEQSAVKGADAPPPSPLNDFGNTGATSLAGTTEPYLHPRVLRAIDAYTAATYAANDLVRTKNFINAYLADYAAYKQTTNWTQLSAADKNQAEAYKASMLARLAEVAKNAARDWRGYP